MWAEIKSDGERHYWWPSWLRSAFSPTVFGVISYWDHRARMHGELNKGEWTNYVVIPQPSNTPSHKRK